MYSLWVRAQKRLFNQGLYIRIYIYTSLQVNQVSLKVSSCRACSLHSGGITPTPLSLFRGKTPLAIFYSGSMNLRLTMHGCDGAIRCNTCVFVFRGTKRANIFYLENLKNKHFVCDFPTQFFVKQYKYKLVSQTVMILVSILSAAWTENTKQKGSFNVSEGTVSQVQFMFASSILQHD